MVLQRSQSKVLNLRPSLSISISGLGSPPAPVVALAFSFGGVFGAAMLFTGGAAAGVTGAVVLSGGDAGVGFVGEAAFGISGVRCVADALAPIFFTPLWVGCNTAFGFGTSVDEDAVDAAGGGG